MIQGTLGLYAWHENSFTPWAGSRLLLVTTSVFNTFCADIKYDRTIGEFVVKYAVGFSQDEALIKDAVETQLLRMEVKLAEHVAKRMEG